MNQEKTIPNLQMTDKKLVLTLDDITKMRKEEEVKKDSNKFIAQSGAQEFGLSSDADIVVFGGNRGGGKANPYRTLVATPTGFRQMGELKVGDPICTPYEGIQVVTEIFEQGEHTIYKVHYDDGTFTECMDNHRFMARTDCLEQFHEMTAREIFDRYKMDGKPPLSLRKGVSEYVEIPLCGEVDMNELRSVSELPINPFVLGFLSGTGYWNYSQRAIRITKDYDTASEIGYRGYKCRKRDDGFFYLTGLTDYSRKKVSISRKYQAATIPPAYMTASKDARWEFLRGVILANGYVAKHHPFVETRNAKFAGQLAEMARSLGIWVRVTIIDDDPKKIGFSRLLFFAPDDRKLFVKHHERKKVYVNGTQPQSVYDDAILSKKILMVSKVKGMQPCRCITVSGRDHLYMTENYTVNHNTVTMLMEPIYDIKNKHFNGIILRKNKDDFENIINESKRWFSKLGRYNKSKDDMTWYFKSGAQLGLTIYDMPMHDFDVKFRGQQFAYIGIDELPQMSFEMFKFLMTSNRNTVGVHSRILGTCNPDPLSWLRKFIDWWIGNKRTVYADGKRHPELSGFAIPERDGVIRYCYMPDDSVDNIIWGDTPEEVYEQCKEMIDDAWDPDWEQYGYTKTSFFVKSVTFIKASLKDNKALIKSDPSYIANLLNQPPEIRAREFDGNWDIIKTGEDMIQASHLDKIFANDQMVGDQVRRATCDVAGTGGDNCVTWLWIGWHVADVFVTRRDPYTTAQMLKSKLIEWGVTEENFTYDLNGMGQVLKGPFPRAVPFNNIEAVSYKYKFMYDNLKSQCAFMFAERSRQCDWSIDPSLLERRFTIGKETKKLYDILQQERKCVKKDMNKADKGDCLISKEQMKHKSIVGHSPDFFEALFMREVFEVKRPQLNVPTWLSKNGHTGIRSVRKLVPRRRDLA